MKITIQNKSGRLSFDCYGNETILYAGLRQGFALPYECATGTCGTCRARVTAGEIDVRWREAPGGGRLKREKGDILMCQTFARSECTLQVPFDIAVTDQSWPQRCRGVIRNIRKLTRDVVQFELHLSTSITFEAGQFVVLEAAQFSGGRAYSIVNFAVAVDRIELLLKRKATGMFSDWLFDESTRDREVQVFGPLGRAVFRTHECKNILCIAGGSGIAGMMSILECAASVDYFRNHAGAVFFGVRTLADTFYLERLARYVAVSHGNLEVTIALSDELIARPRPVDFPAFKLANGMVHEVVDGAINGRYDDTVAYIAGPAVMVDATIRTLIVRAFPNRNIRYDKFS
jgi:toluene monooxygenase electron transfer component